MSRTTTIIITTSIVVFFTAPTFADWRDDARAISISGGEDHTLVLTRDKSLWASGPNGSSGAYYGVLGTGSTNFYLTEKSLVRVLGGDMGTQYMEAINGVDAGWKHSLALERYEPNDPNYSGYVWAWGWNSEGQLGDGSETPRITPVQVLRGEQADDPCQPSGYLKHIVGISAGRSGGEGMEALAPEVAVSCDLAAVEQEKAAVEPVDMDAIMQWLADVWLDPDVRKSIDEEKFLKFYESLREF
ncbi:MAG: hypothetical protein JW720_13525 [Sedimentisphaerales bacterium]|nr:hypothetical protein [Sedimentisphaerales bacterium]